MAASSEAWSVNAPARSIRFGLVGVLDSTPEPVAGAGERDAIVEGFTDDRGIQNEAHTAVRACVVRPQWRSAPSAVKQTVRLGVRGAVAVDGQCE